MTKAIDRTKLRLKAEASRDMPSAVFLAILNQLEDAETERDVANRIIDQMDGDVANYRSAIREADARALAAEVASRGYLERAQRAEATMLLAVRRADEATAAIERVRRVHAPLAASDRACYCCRELWPCPTRRMLDGADS